MKTRMVGGPLNGRVIDVPKRTRVLRAPVLQRPIVAISEVESPLSTVPSFRVVEYERSPLSPVMVIEEAER